MTAGWFALMAAGGAALLGILTWAAKTARGMHRRVTDFLDDWAGQPARKGVDGRPGVMERLQDVEKIVTEVRAETQPNGGHSLRDVVHRTAADVLDVKTDVAKLAGRVELFEHQREDRDS
jgi:hypothetical protein